MIEECKNLAASAVSNDDPVFILGIMPRCGTHFLSDLLLRHPDCGAPNPIWEDNLIRNSGLLLDYVESLGRRWLVPQEQKQGIIDSFYPYLGTGMISFLHSKQLHKRLVTKTPSVDNLANFFKLFPEAFLIILIRDGRAVVESAHLSFGWNYEIAMMRWARAAETIIRFDQANRDSGHKYLIVRYEDLYTNVHEELSRILKFLQLDAKSFDFDAAASLPVRGSSELRKQGADLHWKPVDKKQDFDPLNRWSHWGWMLQARFNRIAGQYLEHFGYDNKPKMTPPFYVGVMHLCYDLRLSILWQVSKLRHSRLILSAE